MDNKVWQEFYCNDCTDGGGYFRVKLNLALNMRVEIVCPKCGRKHPRTIKDGIIKDGYYGSESPKEEIHTTMSAYSKEPLHKKMTKHARDGVVIGDDDLRVNPDFLEERRLELYGAKK